MDSNVQFLSIMQECTRMWSTKVMVGNKRKRDSQTMPAVIATVAAVAVLATAPTVATPAVISPSVVTAVITTVEEQVVERDVIAHL